MSSQADLITILSLQIVLNQSDPVSMSHVTVAEAGYPNKTVVPLRRNKSWMSSWQTVRVSTISPSDSSDRGTDLYYQLPRVSISVCNPAHTFTSPTQSKILFFLTAHPVYTVCHFLRAFFELTLTTNITPSNMDWEHQLTPLRQSAGLKGDGYNLSCFQVSFMVDSKHMNWG